MRLTRHLQLVSVHPVNRGWWAWAHTHTHTMWTDMHSKWHSQ